jgi:hypothetical protein
VKPIAGCGLCSPAHDGWRFGPVCFVNEINPPVYGKVLSTGDADGRTVELERTTASHMKGF